MINSSSRKPLMSSTSAVLMILAAVAANSCQKSRNIEAQQKIAEEIPTVAVAKAGTSDLSRVLVLTAEFTPFQEVDLMAKVAGYVKNINVDIGDRVKKGQLIAVLEIPEMTDEVTKARAGVQRSQAQVTQAQDEVKRAESAHQMVHLNYDRLAAVMKTRPGLIAQQEVDDAQSKDLVAEAQVQSAKSNMAAAVEQVGVTKADLGKYQTMFDYARVTAPFSGVITKRFANTGSMIQAGTASQTQAMPIVRLSENSLLRLTLPVPESAVPTVHVGQPVDVHVPTLNRTFPGKVARFSDKVQSATRTMDTEVDVPNPSMILVPGMYAEVDLTLQRSNNALAVPVSAVDLDNPGSSEDVRKNATGKVLVVKADNHIELRTVTIGLETANRVEIRSGLRDGELVVIGNRAALQPGQVVKPKITVMMARGEN